MSQNSPASSPAQITIVGPTMGDDDDAVHRIKPLVPVPRAIDIGNVSKLLDEAFQIFQRNPLKAWHQAVMALLPVLYATDPNWTRGHRHMIGKLLSELADLDRGRQPAMLRKRKLPHRPPDSIETWRWRAILVHTADLLELNGLSRDAASRKIVTLCKKYNLEIGSRVNSVGSTKILAGWHSELVKGRAPREGLVTYAHLNAKTVGVPSALPATEARRQVLAALESALRADGFGDRPQKEADSD